MQEQRRVSNEANASKEAITEDLGKKATDAAAEERKEQLDEDVDDILNEIDDVLETNAEEFVKSYIQKGGQ